ncbi:MAG: hypothetical protein AB1489_31270, partial [Acidobacteriota bacterium]
MFDFFLLERKLRRVSQRLTQLDLQRPDPEDNLLNNEDMERYLANKTRTGQLFLNYYSRQGLSDALER